LRRPFFAADDATPSDLLRFPVVPVHSRVHPCQKPLGLLSYLIRTATRPGDIVLDPFAGSGSTAAAALASGRRCVLIEREPSAIALIRDRLDAEVRAPRLFA
jgi:site-specific DNA-methyltransferase (adenine-specific)